MFSIRRRKRSALRGGNIPHRKEETFRIGRRKHSASEGGNVPHWEEETFRIVIPVYCSSQPRAKIQKQGIQSNASSPVPSVFSCYSCTCIVISSASGQISGTISYVPRSIPGVGALAAGYGSPSRTHRPVQASAREHT